MGLRSGLRGHGRREDWRRGRLVTERSVQQVLDVAKRKRGANVHHHREADDLGLCFEGAEDARIAHRLDDNSSRPRREPIFL